MHDQPKQPSLSSTTRVICSLGLFVFPLLTACSRSEPAPTPAHRPAAAANRDLAPELDSTFRDLGMKTNIPPAPPLLCDYRVKLRDTNGVAFILKNQDVPAVTKYLQSWLGAPYSTTAVSALYAAKDLGIAIAVVREGDHDVALAALRGQDAKSWQKRIKESGVLHQPP